MSGHGGATTPATCMARPPREQDRLARLNTLLNTRSLDALALRAASACSTWAPGSARWPTA